MTGTALRWNTAALGPNKRRLAATLYHRLKEKYAPLGLAHFGQGKWYPGEQLPRWSLNCYWRQGRRAAMEQPRLTADEQVSSSADDEDTARRFLIARRPQGEDSIRQQVFPAYEDVFLPPVARAPFARQRRSLRFAAGGSDGACAAGQSLRTRLGAERRPCAPRCTLRGRRSVANRLMVLAQRALLPGSRRLADRLPAAARSRSPGLPSEPISPFFMRRTRRGVSPRCARMRKSAARFTTAMPRRSTLRGRSTLHHRLSRRCRCRRSPPPASRARRCVPSRATACCIFSCRPRASWNTTWNWWRRSVQPGPSIAQPVVLETARPPNDPAHQQLPQ